MNASIIYPSLDNAQIANIAACSVVYGLAIMCTIISIYNKARRKVLYVIDVGLMILAVVSLRQTTKDVANIADFADW